MKDIGDVPKYDDLDSRNVLAFRLLARICDSIVAFASLLNYPHLARPGARSARLVAGFHDEAMKVVEDGSHDWTAGIAA